MGMCFLSQLLYSISNFYLIIVMFMHIGMSGFTFITLKLYHGGALLYECNKTRYVGELVSEYYDIVVDTYHILRLKTTLKN